MTLLQKIQNLKWTPDLPYKIKEILLELLNKIIGLESNTGDFIPLSGTEPNKPVTGNINIENIANVFVGNINTDTTQSILSRKGLSLRNTGINDNINNALIGIENSNSVIVRGTVLDENEENIFSGISGISDYSNIDPTNKRIYAQRSYAEKPETLITALNNCDVAQLDTIKGILGIV